VPDAARREELLLELARRVDDTLQRLVGEIGEEIAIDAARAELRAMGRPELAREVRRVSLLSDQLGYTSAHRACRGGPGCWRSRRPQHSSPARQSMHISARNETDTGAALPD
jgi:hypothetical protein